MCNINKFKLFLLLSIPISLIFSNAINSALIILFSIFFLPEAIKGFRLNNTRQKKILFISLLSFVFLFLWGGIIDVFYGFYDFNKTERLLSFLIFPFIFIYSDSFFSKKRVAWVIKYFSFFITVLNLLLAFNFLINTHLNFKDTSLNNERWKKSNVILKDSSEKIPEIEIPAYSLFAKKGYKSSEILYNRKINLSKNSYFTRSIYVKSLGVNWVLLRQFDGERHIGAWFNIKTGEKGHVQKGLKTKIIDIGNGWYRCSITNLVEINKNRERIQISVVSKNLSYSKKVNFEEGLLIGGIQLEIGKIPTIYKPYLHRGYFEDFNRKEILGLVHNHPTYYSIYTLFSIVFYIFFYKKRFFYLLALFVNISMIIFLGSKSAIITMFIALLGFVFFFYKKRHLKKAMGLISLLVFLLLVFFSSFSLGRFKQAFETFLNGGNEVLSTGRRIKIWKTIFDLPPDKLLLGAGNINGHKEIEMTSGLFLNSHNQYLESILCSGLFGFLLLIGYLIGPYLIKKALLNNYFVLSFSIIISISMLFENILNRQWGIVFISFFYSFIIVFYKKIEYD